MTSTRKASITNRWLPMKKPQPSIPSPSNHGKERGRCCSLLAGRDEAAKAFTRALKLDPADAEVYALLGDARNATGDYQVAAEQYLKALAMDPKIAGVTEKLSAVYAAEKMVLPGGNETAVTITTPVVIQNVTVVETTVALPTTTTDGSSGADTGILLSLARWIQENLDSFFKG